MISSLRRMTVRSTWFRHLHLSIYHCPMSTAMVIVDQISRCKCSLIKTMAASINLRIMGRGKEPCHRMVAWGPWWAMGSRWRRGVAAGTWLMSPIVACRLATIVSHHPRFASHIPALHPCQINPQLTTILPLFYKKVAISFLRAQDCHHNPTTHQPGNCQIWGLNWRTPEDQWCITMPSFYKSNFSSTNLSRIWLEIRKQRWPNNSILISFNKIGNHKLPPDNSSNNNNLVKILMGLLVAEVVDSS